LIIIYHQNHKVVQILDVATQENIDFEVFSISKTVIEIAEKFPDTIILWCEISCISILNLEVIPELFHHNKLLLSYSPDDYFSSEIGYVDESPFLNVNKKVSYPTWQMSGLVGGIASSVLIAVKNEVICEANFDYFLCSIAKLGMPLGLFCYSEPKLLKNHEINIKSNFGNRIKLFQFVKQHYRMRWVFLLFLNLMIYEKQFPIMAFLNSFFYKKKKWEASVLDKIEVQSNKKVIDDKTIDVIIPTIGRKIYLYDVLKDLAQQTHLPINVIIVEQSPQLDSQSELDYIEKEVWPFRIKHIFTHQPGACNARNIALSQVESEWVFLNDDDNRFGTDLVESAFHNINKNGTFVALTFYPHSKEKLIHKNISQASIFGSGNSFVKYLVLKNIFFNKKFEFGYGEDTDFGMQIRNKGFDIIYIPELRILHLKAPIGGFRIKVKQLWDSEIVQPKPSPTVLLFKLIHESKQQICGYKTLLFFKYYKYQSIKNPILYFQNYKKQWNKSVFWANELNSNS
jgi:glycosyltransferase involved in cell wall biosynthesis